MKLVVRFYICGQENVLCKRSHDLLAKDLNPARGTENPL